MTTMRTRTVRVIATAASAVALTMTSGVLAAPSYADMGGVPSSNGNGNGNGGGTPSTSPVSTGGDYGSSGPSTGTVSGCRVVSTPSFVGMSCGSGGAGAGQTVKQYFDLDGGNKLELISCPDNPADAVDPNRGSHEEMTSSELAALGYDNGADTKLYWSYCLENPKPGDQVRGVPIQIGIVSLPQPHTETQIQNQLTQLATGLTDSTNPPAPVAVATPTYRPRVGSWTSFVDGTPSQLSVSTGGVTLEANVIGLTVKPLGKDEPQTISCPGSGYKAEKGETKADHPSGCWWKYENSSSGQRMTTAEGLPAYPVQITATWAVDTIVGGVRTRFNTFQKTDVTPLPVTEIQALVIS